MNKVTLLFIFILLTNPTYSQNMKHKYKSLKREEALHYIQTHNGIFKKHPTFSYVNAYDCDDNTLVLENTKEKKYTLYYDRKKYYDDIKDIKELGDFNPLADKQDVIKNISVYKDTLLDQLYTKLAMPKPENLANLDLKKMDQNLELYGYKNAYTQLYLNLIIFCGEYIKAHKGGSWSVRPEGGHSNNFEPVYVDSTGEDYAFMINTLLAREYTEHRRMSVSKIIFSAMLPKIFDVVPNPRLTNPNTQQSED